VVVVVDMVVVEMERGVVEMEKAIMGEPDCIHMGSKGVGCG